MDKRLKIIRVDLAESVFQDHGINAEGEVVIRRKLSRLQVVTYFNQCCTELLWSFSDPCLIKSCCICLK